MLVDEAVYLQARLLEKQGQWKPALALFEDVAKQGHRPAQADAARLRAGVCYARLEQFDKALPLLDAPLSDEDLGLLSDVVFARAQARAVVQDHERAVLDYLYLVVFQPFVQTNEARCLSAALPSYAAMKDWAGLSKSMQVLRTQYAELGETRRAEEWVKPYAKELEQEKAFVLPDTQEE
jgi:tetratricopeptide (TPR) repeat protein